MLSTRSDNQAIQPPALAAAGTRRRRLSFRHLWRAATSKSVLTMMDQVIYSASNFLTAVIVARTATAQDFGLYFLGLRLTDYLREVENVLIWTPYTVFSPRLQGVERARYTGSTFIHQLSFSSVGALLFILAGILLSLFSQPGQITSAMWSLAFVAAMVPLQEYSRRICFANFQTQAVIMLDGVVTLLQLCGLALLVSVGMMSVNNAYWVIGAANCFAALCWLVWARRSLEVVGKQVRADFQRNFALGKWLLGGNLTQLVGQQFFPWSLNAWHGAVATGIYAACEGVINFIRAFMISVQNFLGPRLAHAWARGGTVELRQVVRRTTLLLGLIVGMLCVLVAVAGGGLVKLLYGGQYAGLHRIVALLAANIFVQAITTSHAYALSTMERPEVNFKINLIGLVLTATAGLVAVKAFGTVGAAFGLLTSTIVVALLRYAAFARLSGSGVTQQ